MCLPWLSAWDTVRIPILRVFVLFYRLYTALFMYSFLVAIVFFLNIQSLNYESVWLNCFVGLLCEANTNEGGCGVDAFVVYFRYAHDNSNTHFNMSLFVRLYTHSRTYPQKSWARIQSPNTMAHWTRPVLRTNRHEMKHKLNNCTRNTNIQHKPALTVHFIVSFCTFQ